MWYRENYFGDDPPRWPNRPRLYDLNGYEDFADNNEEYMDGLPSKDYVRFDYGRWQPDPFSRYRNEFANPNCHCRCESRATKTVTRSHVTQNVGSSLHGYYTYFIDHS